MVYNSYYIFLFSWSIKCASENWNLSTYYPLVRHFKCIYITYLTVMLSPFFFSFSSSLCLYQINEILWYTQKSLEIDLYISAKCPRCNRNKKKYSVRISLFSINLDSDYIVLNFFVVVSFSLQIPNVSFIGLTKWNSIKWKVRGVKGKIKKNTHKQTQQYSLDQK